MHYSGIRKILIFRIAIWAEPWMRQDLENFIAQSVISEENLTILQQLMDTNVSYPEPCWIPNTRTYCSWQPSELLHFSAGSISTFCCLRHTSLFVFCTTALEKALFSVCCASHFQFCTLAVYQTLRRQRFVTPPPRLQLSITYDPWNKRQLSS